MNISALTLEKFVENLPHRPYCTDHHGRLFIRPKAQAITRRHLQHNPPHLVRWLTFDIDRPFSAFAWEFTAPPNLVVVNPDNGHAHISYELETPVYIGEKASQKAVKLLIAIQEALIEKLGADDCYTGLITKNPVHEHWRTLSPREDAWTLYEFLDWVDLKKQEKRPKKELKGLGRNDRLFYDLRYWAYKYVVQARQDGSYEDWFERCLNQAERYNSFDIPLSFAEVKATAKSVSRWTWKYYTGCSRVNCGAMGLSDRGLELHVKQSMSARATNNKRQMDTVRKIKVAIQQLQVNGVRVTKPEIMKITGLSKSTVQRVWKNLF